MNATATMCSLRCNVGKREEVATFQSRDQTGGIGVSVFVQMGDWRGHANDKRVLQSSEYAAAVVESLAVDVADTGI